MPFDPSQPSTIESGPSEAKAAKFDPSKPSELVALEPEQAATPPAPKFPQDDPKYEYGNIAPLAKNKETGALSLAFPEMVRQPARGFVDLSNRLKGPLTPEKMRGLNPDELSTVMAAGGMRVSPLNIISKSTAKAMAQVAHDAGYVLPPIEATTEPSMLSKVLSSPAGKIKTQQLASETNQEITNGLAAEGLGVPKDTVLTDKVFRDVRAKAGKQYQAVAKAIPEIEADPDYIDAVSGLGGSNSQAAKFFPNITKNQEILNLVDELKQVGKFPTEAGVEVVKELRYNATANLKAADDPSRHALGLAQREAAGLIDDLMERNIERSGQEGVIAAYKQARRLIAKSYDVEGVTNLATGDVNAAGLAKLAAKGRPLTDQLKTISDVASAFPKDVQNPARFGGAEPWSGLDFFGAVGAAAAGHPGAAAGVIARPFVRSTILSGPYQRNMLAPRVQAGIPPRIRALLSPAIPPGAANAVGGLQSWLPTDQDQSAAVLSGTP